MSENIGNAHKGIAILLFLGCEIKFVCEIEALREDAECWRLDTIEQEEKLCHLYAKMGYHKTGETEHVKDGMDLVFFEKRVEH